MIRTGLSGCLTWSKLLNVYFCYGYYYFFLVPRLSRPSQIYVLLHAFIFWVHILVFSFLSFKKCSHGENITFWMVQVLSSSSWYILNKWKTFLTRTYITDCSFYIHTGHSNSIMVIEFNQYSKYLILLNYKLGCSCVWKLA